VRREIGWILAGSWVLIVALVVVPYVLGEDPFGWSATTVRLGEFSDVDASEGSVGGTRPTDTAPMITEPDRVQRVLAVVDSLRTGWRIPWTGTPEGAIAFRLFSADEYVGGFEMGPGFLVNFSDGGFYSRPSSPSDQQELLNALGLSEQDMVARDARGRNESGAAAPPR